MTYHPERAARDRLRSSADHMRRAAAAAPLVRYARRNPILLIGAAVVGIVGVFAWRNRDRISAEAGPLIRDARVKGQSLLEEARIRGGDLIEQARTATSAMATKATRSLDRDSISEPFRDTH